ncbi:polyphosphate kinase [Jiella sp. MQZ9-1]|uniref:Polyphosphate kinase n=1 Tax=Jiella flava TaxID=2816857 RepID=A0A939FVY8_9HYPH|nr:polyphosphate kinase [Jiella flava]MBO0661786.1 polyphosphate kinase [Jiella flava]MCD2470427.1 polyphosphate kinase [Jiella flava]
MRLDDLDMTARIDDHAYDRAMAKLLTRFEAIHQAYLHHGSQGVVVFEGWDAAGKGGAIRRMSSVMDPRGLKVWPIGAPSEADRSRHYLARFFERLPQDKEIAVFDRSWYGRVLVERVEGFTEEKDWRRAYGEIDAFEKMLADAGTRIAKVFLYIDPDEQLKRFEKRLADPLKRWKLTYEDFRNREKWDQYVAAVNDMLARTDTAHAPWHVVPANQKKYARVSALSHVADRLSEGIDLTPPPPEPGLEERFREEMAKG